MSQGLRPLPLLTAVNFFNYLDRQVVYTMTNFIGEDFHLSKFQLGWLSAVNLVVFALTSLISGPIADRLGPRKVIFSGVLVWSIATVGSALSTSFPMLLFFRGLVGVGEGAYGPSAVGLLCATSPPKQRGRTLGIYNAGMAFGASAGLFLGAVLAPHIGWRGVFWIAAAPSFLFAAMTAFIASPERLERPKAVPARKFLLNPTFIICTLGGVLVTFGANALLFWSRWLIVDERGFSVMVGSVFMLLTGLLCGMGGVLAGGYAGDAAARRRRGGHSLVTAVSLTLAVPASLGCLVVSHKLGFAILVVLAVFLLSVYNGPAAVIVDELAPPQFAVTLQAVYMFCIHVFGNAPAGAAVGYFAQYTTVANALLITVVAFVLSALMFFWTAHRQRREVPY